MARACAAGSALPDNIAARSLHTPTAVGYADAVIGLRVGIGMKRAPRAFGGLIVGALVAAATACGPARYIPAIRSAEVAVAKATDVKGQTFAPYWFTKATAYLAKAKEEAAAADYGQALKYAETAKIAADRAVSLSRDRGPTNERGEGED